ncbi:hypothetical protein LWI29_017504 [Acer saccharum]|uniref:Uncharacterized protein n=1 Tax=Acer saccharum TaxID=4024 RepID=A0AA39RCX9_ACESA|nr:hypothetical protein LWI29_017504 [Acer saccharum]
MRLGGKKKRKRCRFNNSDLGLSFPLLAFPSFIVLIFIVLYHSILHPKLVFSIPTKRIWSSSFPSRRSPIPMKSSVLSRSPILLLLCSFTYQLKNYSGISGGSKLFNSSSKTFNFSSLKSCHGSGLGIVGLALTGSSNGGFVDLSESETPPQTYAWPDNKKPCVCILGAGFGGLYTALRLESLVWPDHKRPQGSPYCKFFKWTDSYEEIQFQLQEFNNELLNKEKELQKILDDVEKMKNELRKRVDDVEKREMVVSNREMVLLEKETDLRHGLTLLWVHLTILFVIACYLIVSK